jgi:hypothetical protein
LSSGAKNHITMAYDDRPEVVAMYHKHGVPAQVHAINKRK